MTKPRRNQDEIRAELERLFEFKWCERLQKDVIGNVKKPVEQKKAPEVT